MKKSLLVILMVVFATFCVNAEITQIYTDFGSANGVALDTNAQDSAFFKIDNPLLDSVVIYYSQYASTDNPSVTCSLMVTVDDLGAGKDIAGEARKATWANIAEVFSALSAESAVQYYPQTEAVLAGSPGRWYMLRFVGGATADHDETSRILKAGIITMRKPD